MTQNQGLLKRKPSCFVIKPLSESPASNVDDGAQSDLHPSKGIQSLPDELLREIFEHATALYTEKLDINRSLLPALLATCTRWRANAFSTPRLWSFIYFAYRVTRGADGQDAVYCTLDSVPTYLRHSQLHQFELRVEISLEWASQRDEGPLRSALNTLAMQLVSHAPRCVAIDIVEEGQRHQLMFLPTRAMVNLRHLRLKTACRRSASELFPARLCGQIPPSERKEMPLFTQLDYNLETLDVDIINRHLADTSDDFSFVTLDYASELAGLRRLKVNIHHLPYFPIREVRSLVFHDLQVIALIGHDHVLRQKVHIVAPNLLYIAYTPVGSRSWDVPWHFPQLMEIEMDLDASTVTVYHDFIASDLFSLRTLTAHATTIAPILRAADSSAAPNLRVLRVPRVVRHGQNPMVPFELVDAVLKVLEARQDVRVESDSWSIMSLTRLSSIAPGAIKARLHDVEGRWRDAREVSIVDRFFG